MQRAATKPSQTGFTLIELMIVIVIIGILGSIALPAYTRTVIKAGRSDGQGALLIAAQTMERCATTNINNGYTGCAVSATSSEGKYTLSLSNLTASTFTITATPAAGTSQAGDTDCTTLTITHTNLRGATGANTAVCW